jgi:hypothetical protein
MGMTHAQQAQLLAWNWCVYQAFHTSVWGSPYIRGKMQQTAHDRQESIRYILWNKMMCNGNNFVIWVQQESSHIIHMYRLKTFSQWNLLPIDKTVCWWYSENLCTELKNGGEYIYIYIMMIKPGGPTCLRMDMNAAQVEEQILEDHMVDIWEQLKKGQEIYNSWYHTQS